MIYRQLAHKLRVDMGPDTPDFYSERPRRKRDGIFLDLDDDGLSTTRVEFPDGARVDVEALIRNGAIEPVPAWRSPSVPPIVSDPDAVGGTGGG